MSIITKYKNTKNKEHREWFLLGCLLALGLLIMNTLVLILSIGTEDYYYANNGLFIYNVIIFILIIKSKDKTKDIFLKLKLLFINNNVLNLYDYGDLMLFFTYLLAVFSFILILDFSFFTNYGIRISAVIGVSITKLIKDLFITKK